VGRNNRAEILKMPKSSTKAEEAHNHDTGPHPAPVSKTTAMAEIILFPNGKNEIPFIPGSETDPETKTRWLHLADDALDGNRKRKKA
jgi:hypothetical protein